MIRTPLHLIAPLAALGPAPAALAQRPEPGREITWFEMFFLPGDPVGLAVVWLLLMASIASIGYMIRLFIQYRRPAMVPERTRHEIQALIAQERYADAIELAESDDSYLGVLASNALNEAANGYGAMERALEEAGDAETNRYLRPVEYLNIVGNIAPMLGLFGTVYGMIRAFQELVASGGSPDPVRLAAGISTALVTTFWGLVVAIPALAAYALIRNKIDALSSEGMLVAERLISPFKPGQDGRAESGSKEAR